MSVVALYETFFHSGLPSENGTKPQSPLPTSAIFFSVQVTPAGPVVPMSNALSVLKLWVAVVSIGWCPAV